MPLFGNTFYPTSYNPYQYAPQYQQPQYNLNAMPQTPQNVQQPQAPAMTQNSIVWIADEKDALSYPIAPNNAVALWEISGKRLYVKSADATGKPSIKTYDLVEHIDADSSETAKDAPFATKDDLSAVVSAVKDLSGVVSSIKGEVDGIKGDVYGIAGKRKTAKKTEAAEDDE